MDKFVLLLFSFYVHTYPLYLDFKWFIQIVLLNATHTHTHTFAENRPLMEFNSHIRSASNAVNMEEDGKLPTTSCQN